MSDAWALIVLGALLTYVTRIIGHVIATRFAVLPPRVEAVLNAVPSAVLTALVAPVVVSGAWPERLGILVALVCALRLPQIATVAIGTAVVIAGRAMGY
ncbi:AzlD family protein [Consotaella salsifontis]|uniref:Uncharacterized membrane protein n=1 Tax=Consotaella salsifontis TaxID=1365950 RepID=A0A1T4M8Y0_9HYPH|nr:AzlD domain-containing protein [Consotaella salsifontis]SJZ63459.1 Uncharacterized membrane protein [Consotaella salsifontis]